ncbi:S9 family peptidase [Pararhizobium sp. DWP3-4]|uniref:S9 family peptidase n=1 Tax=Pararhizobium sp. DWP3-4 TaxID=2804565 RepID=UPI003CF90087
MTKQGLSGRFRPEDVLLYQSIQALSCHRDADFALCEVSVPDSAQDANATSFWLVPLDGREAEQFTSGEGGDTGAAWSPDGTTIAFVTSRTGTLQIHLINRNGGESRALTQMDNGPLSLKWAPNGLKLFATAKVAVDPECRGNRGKPAEGQRPQVVWRLPYKTDGIGYILDREIHLFSIDLESGDARQLTDGPFDIRGMDCSADGSRIAFTRTRTGREAHGTDLWIMNVDGSHAEQISFNVASASSPCWSPDSQSIVFAGSEEEGASRQRPWIADPDAKSVSPLGDESIEVESGSSFFWSEDSKRVVFILARRSVQEIATVAIENGRLDVIVTGERHVIGLAAMPNRIIFAATSLTEPAELYSCGWKGEDETKLTNFNAWWSDREKPRTMLRTFDVPNEDNATETIDGWLMLPPGDSQGPFPLLVDVHGGPHAIAYLEFGKQVYRHVLCSRGWAVLSLNPVGSSSYGREFAERLRGRWGDLDLKQHIAAIRKLQEENLVDDRIAIAGKSYGGFQAAWAITQTDMFKSAVISAPVSNIESHFGTSDSGYYVTPFAMLGEPFVNPEPSRELSPLVHMNEARTPTLLLQGMDDQRCPIGQSEEIFATLMRSSDTAVEMVLYPGGSHHLLEEGQPSFRIDYITRVVEWVERWTNRASDDRDTDPNEPMDSAAGEVGEAERQKEND